jgi:hypothetical protein
LDLLVANSTSSVSAKQKIKVYKIKTKVVQSKIKVYKIKTKVIQFGEEGKDEKEY